MTVTETVPQAIAALERLFDQGLRWPRPMWPAYVRQLWRGPEPDLKAQVVIPIWRDPWMVVGRSTFTDDLVRRLGWGNLFAGHHDRYPRVDLSEIDGAGADIVLLPDEPYVFTRDDGPEAFMHTPTQLVSGRLLTWYGPSLVEARRTFVAIDLTRD